MKKIFSSRRRHYVARVCIFLITLALVVEMVGCSCGGGGGVNYDLTISSTTGGSVTPGVGKHTYAAGTSVKLEASPASGYRFDNWTGNVGNIADVNAAKTTITMNGRYSITANFKAVYDLTISSTDGGSVTNPGVGKHTYDVNTTVKLEASPASGYRFVNWTGNTAAVAAIHDANSAKTTINMQGSYNITANFKVVYDLTISSTDGGSVTKPGEGKHTYDVNTKVNLLAEAEKGYRFVNWTGNAAALAAITDVNAASTTIIMSGSYNITANFKEIQYKLTIYVNDWEAGWVLVWEEGSGWVPGVGTSYYAAGTEVKLEAVRLDQSSIFWEWTGDTDYIADVYDPTTTIIMWGDYTITANFWWIFW